MKICRFFIGHFVKYHKLKFYKSQTQLILDVLEYQISRMKNREMVIETWNSQQSNRNMYLRSQGVDVPNVKVQLYYHGIKST